MLASASTSSAQVAGKWGFGGFISYTNPLFTFGDRFNGGVDKWGLTASYVTGSRVTMEAEYHHADMADGVLENGQFTWSPKALTSKQYSSKDINPNSAYTNRSTVYCCLGCGFLMPNAQWMKEVFLLTSLWVVVFMTTRQLPATLSGRVKAQQMPAVLMQPMSMSRVMYCLRW